jgi:apolipoprotein N-acyltransferase
MEGHPSTPGSTRSLLAAAGAGGLVYALAFPPFELPGAAGLALVPLLAAAAVLPPGRAAAAGLVWALAATLAVCAWLPGTLALLFGLPVALGWLALVGVALVPVGLAMGGLGAWTAWAARRGCATPLTLAAACAAAELARSYAWPPTPWALLGASALPEALLQSADLVGGQGLGLLVAGCSAALACALVPALRSRRAAGEALALALAAAALSAYGATRGDEAASGPRLRVAVVQPGKAAAADDPAPPPATLALTRALRDRGLDLVVWPENALGGYLRERTPGSQAVLALSRELPGELLLGGAHYRYAVPEPTYFASAFLLRGGALVARHDKTRLVPFAEAGYAAGARARVLAGERAGVGALVCAELLFPGVARALARDGAELLANPSNDAWLAPPASEHLLRVARLRAIENRRALLRSTPTGVSAVIDARGRILARTASAAPAVLEAALRASDRKTLTQRLGDWPASLAVLGLAGATFQGRRRAALSRRTHA